MHVLMAVNGSSVQLNCTHKKDSSFVQMYWYRQRPGQTMTLIVFTSTLSSKHDYADSDPNKFPAIKTVPESGSLTVNNVESDDSAVYFCSVRQKPKGRSVSFPTQGTKVTNVTRDVPFQGNCILQGSLWGTVYPLAGDSDVSQVPSVLMAVNGSSVQLNCTHKKDSSFVQMYWYRQRPGQTMTLIVFTSTLSSKHDYADSDPNKFPAIKTVPESGSLTVNSVESDDKFVSTQSCKISLRYSSELRWNQVQFKLQMEVVLFPANIYQQLI
uniref:Ig-like domain-containing protein n=1 Tax=Sinocyclocheilus grahami TaxID=75366 RepID=A0A672MZF6_SINGR